MAGRYHGTPDDYATARSLLSAAFKRGREQGLLAPRRAEATGASSTTKEHSERTCERTSKSGAKARKSGEQPSDELRQQLAQLLVAVRALEKQQADLSGCSGGGGGGGGRSSEAKPRSKWPKVVPRWFESIVDAYLGSTSKSSVAEESSEDAWLAAAMVLSQLISSAAPSAWPASPPDLGFVSQEALLSRLGGGEGETSGGGGCGGGGGGGGGRGGVLLPPELARSLTALAAACPLRGVSGSVRTVTDFGAFVDLGAARDGLLHSSRLGGVSRHLPFFLFF